VVGAAAGSETAVCAQQQSQQRQALICGENPVIPVFSTGESGTIKRARPTAGVLKP